MAKKQPNFRRFWTAAAVVAAIIIAAVLRIWGIRWGLPDSFHQLTYHPDEIFQVAAMDMLNPFRLALDPHFYNYPSGYMNLGSAALRVAAGYGLRLDDAHAFLIARMVTVALGVLTVPVVYGAGAKLYGKAAGILAALVFALIPLHIVHSHFATVDVPATLWVAAALLGAAAIVSRPTMKIYLLAGAAAGFAAGTKYNAGLALLPVVVAHFLRDDAAGLRTRLRDGRLWASVGGFVVGFLISTPGFVIWPGKFVHGLLFELKHAASGHGQVFEGYGPGWFITLSNSLGYGLGAFLLVMCLVGAVLAVVRRRRSDWILLSFLVPYYLLISFSKVHFTRYAIPLLPPLAILTGRVIAEIYAILKQEGATGLRYVWTVLCAGIVVYTGIYAVAFDRLFSAPDPRTQAAEWFQANVPAGATVGLPGVPWFYSPPLAPGITGTVGRENRYRLMSESRYRLITNPETDWDLSILTEQQPEYFIASDFEYQDPLRLRNPRVLKSLEELGRHYRVVRVFENNLSAFGINFGPTERLPHDLKYMAPEVAVYRRK